MSVFRSANILLPKKEYLDRWAVVACDQYTSQPEYWRGVRAYVAGAPSTVNLVLPEAELEYSVSNQVGKIHNSMREYLENDVFSECEQSYIYVERTMSNGLVRKGIVGVIDLEYYDFTPGCEPLVRATEKTVVERIPPRKLVRQGASLDLSHVQLLADDEHNLIFGYLQKEKSKYPKVYSFDLMEQGGHISGWLISGADAEQLTSRISAYESFATEKYGKIVYAVGDGNHSLATAKACYEESKEQRDGTHNMLRYALVELQNIHDAAIEFEPIHRIAYLKEPERLLQYLQEKCSASYGHRVDWYMGSQKGTIYLNREISDMPIAVLQSALDDYFAQYSGTIDYIHGTDVVKQLSCGSKRIGFVLPAVSKTGFFSAVLKDGVMPRKTFSMGHAHEKRFYLETRLIG